MLLPAQMRMARAALGISVRELSEMAAVAESTILRFETNKGGLHAATLDKIRAALETGGVIFVRGDDEGGPGVRLKA